MASGKTSNYGIYDLETLKAALAKLEGARRLHPFLDNRILFTDRREAGLALSEFCDRSMVTYQQDTGRYSLTDAGRSFLTTGHLPPLSDEISPMDGRWLSGHQTSGKIASRHIFPKDEETVLAVIPNKVAHIRIIAGDFVPEMPWQAPEVVAAAAAGRLDGSNRIAILCFDEGVGSSMIMTRAVERDAEGWLVRVGFEGFETYMGQRPRMYVQTTALAGAASILIAAETERLLLRSMELNRGASVRVELDMSGFPDKLRPSLTEDFEKRLNGDALRLEPDNWHGPKVRIISEIAYEPTAPAW